jgi:hypothetical protein
MPKLTSNYQDIPAGSFVKVTSDPSQDPVSIEVWTSNGLVKAQVPNNILDTAAPQFNQQAITPPLFVAKPPVSSKTQARVDRCPFDFSDVGVAISCRCGQVTKKLDHKLIKLWSAENAALNYVISLCANCSPYHQRESQ